MLNAFSFDVDELEPAMRESADLPLVDAPSFIVENTEFTLRMLERHGVRATFFINGRSVAPHPGLIRRIAEEGHEIGVHSFSHRFLDRYEKPQDFREDMESCIDLIRGEIDEQPIGYRAPGNSLCSNLPVALDVLRDLGFRYSSSIPMVASPRQHGIRHGPEHPFVWDNGLIEFPLPGIRVAGAAFPVLGAHVLRLLPYWCTAAGLRRLNASGGRGFLYAHSFEFFNQPLTRECLWASYGQRAYLLRRGPQMARKVDRLLSEFQFAPYREFLDGDYPKGDFVPPNQR